MRKSDHTRGNQTQLEYGPKQPRMTEKIPHGTKKKQKHLLKRQNTSTSLTHKKVLSSLICHRFFQTLQKREATEHKRQNEIKEREKEGATPLKSQTNRIFQKSIENNRRLKRINGNITNTQTCQPNCRSLRRSIRLK